MGIVTHYKLSNRLPGQWKGNQAVKIADRLMKCALPLNADFYLTLLTFGTYLRRYGNYSSAASPEQENAYFVTHERIATSA